MAQRAVAAATNASLRGVRRIEPYVELQRSRSPDRPALSGLQETERHGAGIGDQLAYLVEEHRSAIGNREQADPG